MSQLSPEPSDSGLPSGQRIASVYDQLVAVARDRLERPLSTRVRSWEDGEIEVRAYHGYGPHTHRPGVAYHHVVRYHSGERSVTEAILEVDVDSAEKTVMWRDTEDADGVVVDAGRPSEKMRDVTGGD